MRMVMRASLRAVALVLNPVKVVALRRASNFNPRRALANNIKTYDGKNAIVAFSPSFFSLPLGHGGAIT